MDDLTPITFNAGAYRQATAEQLDSLKGLLSGWPKATSIRITEAIWGLPSTYLAGRIEFDGQPPFDFGIDAEGRRSS